jgi:hypothetical protein
LPDSRPSSIIVGALIRFIAGLISDIPLAGSGRRSGEIMIDSRELNSPSSAKRRAFAARRFRYLTRRELCVALVVMRLSSFVSKRALSNSQYLHNQSWDGWFTKTSGSPVATVIESSLRGPMRISAPGDCNNALRQSSGALAVQTGLLTVVGDPVEQDKAIVFAGAIVLIAVQKFFTKLKQRLVPN